MKTKVNLITLSLLALIFILGGISLFIVSKIKEEKPLTVSVKTKAASVTYRKFITLNTAPTPTSIIEEFTPTPTKEMKATVEETPTEETPTPINLVTTPILSPTVGERELAYTNPTETNESLSETEATPFLTKKIVKNLPQSGIYQISFLIFLAAIGMIFFSFLL